MKNKLLIFSILFCLGSCSMLDPDEDKRHDAILEMGRNTDNAIRYFRTSDFIRESDPHQADSLERIGKMYLYRVDSAIADYHQRFTNKNIKIK